MRITTKDSEIELVFLCLNESCSCLQNKRLHQEIHNEPFELNDAESISFENHPVSKRYVKVLKRCNKYSECHDNMCSLECMDDRNLYRRMTPEEIIQGVQ